jgi:hypothetical protein
MSFFETASLVLISDFAAASASAVSGSGTSTGKAYSIKPTDGSGDFDFERGSDITATRVNSSGLIEKGRGNFLLQSNNFDTTWITSNVSVTGSQSGYDGSNDAWILRKTGTTGNINQTVSSLTNVQTFSIYAKPGDLNWIRIIRAGKSIFVDLENQVTGSISAGVIDVKITPINEWSRISLTINQTSTNTVIYPADGDDDISGTSGFIYIQDAQLEPGLVATDYIETTTAPLRAGLLEDEPRFDYHNSASATPNTCPSLLLEPQRTNLIEYSEYLGEELTGNRMAINDVVDTSPEGVVNASKLVPDTTPNQTHQSDTNNYGSFVSGDKITISMFAKADGFDGILLRFRDTSGAFTTNRMAIFDLNRGRWENLSMDGTTGVMTGEVGMEDYGNGWYRCFATATADASGDVDIRIPVVDVTAQDTYDETFTGDNTSGVLIYGLQLEEGFYPTSYIPTYGTAATRGVDNLTDNTLSIDGLFGTTEGSIFLEFTNPLPTGLQNNSFYFAGLGGGVSGFQRIRGYWQFNFPGLTFSPNGNLGNVKGYSKILAKWSNGSVKLFTDGVENAAATYTGGDINMQGTANNINGSYDFAAGDSQIKTILFSPEALSDTDCEILTGATTYSSFAAMASALNYTVYE